MQYIKLVISLKDEYQESLIAELSEIEFDAFQQLDEELITFIAKERFHIGDRERIERLLAGYPGEGYIQSEEVVADQNWNEEWEKTISAQRIGPFLVKPTWSSERPSKDEILLEIDPKMAFGTGYHETTRLMLRQLPDFINKGDSIVDAGTGTGILAIAAVKLGAEKVLAFDIDEWSITNTRENIYLNKTADTITVKKGSIETLGDNELFDGILANIERNIILEMIPAFLAHLKQKGRLLVSGILKKDEDVVLEKLVEHKFSHVKTVQENEWVALWLEKKAD